jgi:hypothetical protein
VALGGKLRARALQFLAVLAQLGGDAVQFRFAPIKLPVRRRR